jgi:hypothetical protein
LGVRVPPSAQHRCRSAARRPTIRLPSKRRAYRADAEGPPILEQLMVSIDRRDIHFD